MHALVHRCFSKSVPDFFGHLREGELQIYRRDIGVVLDHCLFGETTKLAIFDSLLYTRSMMYSLIFRFAILERPRREDTMQRPAMASLVFLYDIMETLEFIARHASVLKQKAFAVVTQSSQMMPLSSSACRGTTVSGIRCHTCTES